MAQGFPNILVKPRRYSRHFRVLLPLICVDPTLIDVINSQQSEY